MKASSLLLKLPVAKTITIASLLGLSVVAGAANAASQCKGLSNAECVSAQSCGWVEAYQRKDGREVNAFCRTSSKGKTKKVASDSADKSSASTLKKAPAKTG